MLKYPSPPPPQHTTPECDARGVTIDDYAVKNLTLCWQIYLIAPWRTLAYDYFGHCAKE